jgi:hypothetical protein
MTSAPYEFGVQSDRLVEAWASFRLPFEPRTGYAKSFRAELAAAVGSLRGQRAEILSCAYVSPRARREADVENVLFYNVGAWAFARRAHRVTIRAPLRVTTEISGRYFVPALLEV